MIRREAAIFLVVGSLTVLVDLVVYRGLLGTGVLGVDPAKGAGFLAGTVFSYFANRAFTFGRPGSPLRFALVYGATLLANVGINSGALAMGAHQAIAFLAATGVSAILNFAGMKLFVFGHSPRTEPT